MPSQADRIAGWMRERLAASGARGFVVGLSGGVDSAVVAGLAQIAAGANVVGVLMPCHSDARDESDARVVADHFQLRTLRIDLAQPYDALISGLLDATSAIPGTGGGTPDDIRARLPHVNVKPRLRMTTLYFVANTLNYLVAGTGNRSELVLGYFTKYGDGGVDLLPIGHLVKSQVRELARELGIPAPIIDKAPSAGLWIGQTDEAEMGFTYADLERYLTDGKGSVTPALADQIDRLMHGSEHKRALAPVPQF
ncbi:MAG TPA: NAD(+) synthase [Vicinamibacterales bacterium]|jgi:NAD+ synthase